MALAEAPPVEDEIVLRHLRQRRVERAPRRRRQDHIVEGPARNGRLDGSTSGRTEQTWEANRRHTSPYCVYAGQSNPRPPPLEGPANFPSQSTVRI